jgi:hypothetical protein
MVSQRWKKSISKVQEKGECCLDAGQEDEIVKFYEF